MNQNLIRMKKIKSLFLASLLIYTSLAISQETKDINISALKFRSIGPAVASGRVVDIAVNPKNTSERYIAVASGNVWKTNNAGITWKPIFDNYASYSTSDVEIDPNNSNIVWVATGEYNSQRAIGFGDGVYVSFDAGKSFKNVGLKKSEHIGRIAISPDNSTVYVAAQGPLWGAGGERGLYKTSDYGKTWERILFVSENTGINDVVIDVNNPKILYATSYQRRRRVFTLIDGGEESTIYKSTDAGKTWSKIEKGLPAKKMGRIGIAISPVNSQYLYAMVEAQEGKGGVFRSTDAGASWTKMNKYIASSPQYYCRLYCDPIDENKIYAPDTYSRYSIDGGKSWTKFGLKNKHVDDHCLWINPKNTQQIMIGCDGGLYETFDNGANWRHIENLPVTQFYRVETDNAYPFYNVYGGTQDNNTLGGPSRTLSAYGIINGDWFTTVGGDGFQSRIDPENPDIVYSQAQYGWLVRYNKKNGERVSIQPQPPIGEAYRWNWNAPLIISPHNHNRLYFAANKVFRSDDQGQSWKVISPDLTRQLDRNQLKVMGKIQSPEAVAKNASTSLFGNIVYIDESPIKEGLLYIGTDDGLIQVSEDAGKNWRKLQKIENVPEMTYVSSIRASQFDENVVYVTFDGRKNNDFTPYVFKSTDKGKTWKSISNNLKERFIAYTIVEDFKNPNLLFVGTEFGIFYSKDGGNKWSAIKKGIPTIPVRDIAIQKRESDLVLATFGRGFYILDNYDPLRYLDSLQEKAYYVFPVKNALQFVKTTPLYGQGATYFKGENPPMAVCFTYFVKEADKSLKDIRKEKNKKLAKENKDIIYPSFEDLTAEDLEKSNYLLFVIKDKSGKIIRQLPQPIKKGMQRLYWDMKLSSASVMRKTKAQPFKTRAAHLALPGDYSLSLWKIEKGKIKDLHITRNFKILPYLKAPIANQKSLFDLQEKVQDFNKNYSFFVSEFNKTKGTIKKIMAAYHTAKDIDTALYSNITETQKAIDSLNIYVFGNKSISKRNGNQSPSLNDRFYNVYYTINAYTGAPTQTAIEQFEIVKILYKKAQASFDAIKKDITKYKENLTKIGAVYIAE